MHKNNNPDLSVVICTFNTKEMTLKCLNHLFVSIKKSNKNVEVILVENGTDGTGVQVKKIFPDVMVLKQKKNTGFATGNNIGISKVNKSSKYILLLNTDVMVNPDTIKKSFQYMASNLDCDVLGCKLKFGNGHVQPSAGYLPTPFSIFTWISGMDLIPVISKIWHQIHPRFNSFFETDHQVEWVMGAYFFASKKVFDKIGGFDMKLFMYMEEIELCKRIKDNDYKMFFDPSFWVTHLDKGSQMGDITKSLTSEILGMIYFIKKYYKESLVWLVPSIKFFVILRSVAFLAIGNLYRSKIYWSLTKSL